MGEWVKFYHGKWQGSEAVQNMSLEERGLYITLLALQASNGTVPADLRQISRITGLDLRLIKRLFPRLSHLFLAVETAGETRLANPTMTGAYEDAKRSRTSRPESSAQPRPPARKSCVVTPVATRVAAGLGAKRDTHSRARTCAVPPKGGGGYASSTLLFSGSKTQTTQQGETSPAREECPATAAELPASSAAPSPAAPGPAAVPACPVEPDPLPKAAVPASAPAASSRRTPQPEEPPGFTEFYALFPRRLNPRDALRAYRAEVRTPELHRRLMAGTRKALGGLFRDRSLDKIPYPATWIRSGTWKDARSQLDAPPHSSGRPPQPGALGEDDYPDLTARAENLPPAGLSPAARERLLNLATSSLTSSSFTSSSISSTSFLPAPLTTTPENLLHV